MRNFQKGVFSTVATESLKPDEKSHFTILYNPLLVLGILNRCYVAKFFCLKPTSHFVYSLWIKRAVKERWILLNIAPSYETINCYVRPTNFSNNYITK